MCIEYSRIKDSGVRNPSNICGLYHRSVCKFTSMIYSDEPFVIVKYGDGEFMNMISENESERNCDSCNYYKDLGLDLIASYIHALRTKNVYICSWHLNVYSIQKFIERDNREHLIGASSKFLHYDILLHKMPFDPNLIEFFKTIRDYTGPKVYISNKTMIGVVTELLRLTHSIPVAEINCYLKKDDIVKEARGIIRDILGPLGLRGPRPLILLSAGMFSKVLIQVLCTEFPECTYIDIGSTFDGLVKGTRDFNQEPGYKDALLSAYGQT
jgi:hypothetical protein